MEKNYKNITFHKEKLIYKDIVREIQNEILLP